MVPGKVAPPGIGLSRHFLTFFKTSRSKAALPLERVSVTLVTLPFSSTSKVKPTSPSNPSPGDSGLGQDLQLTCCGPRLLGRGVGFVTISSF